MHSVEWTFWMSLESLSWFSRQEQLPSLQRCRPLHRREDCRIDIDMDPLGRDTKEIAEIWNTSRTHRNFPWLMIHTLTDSLSHTHKSWWWFTTIKLQYVNLVLLSVNLRYSQYTYVSFNRTIPSATSSSILSVGLQSALSVSPSSSSLVTVSLI